MRMGWAGALMGFAFGGFLDGILLHQILQWHHLLSGWRPGGTVGLLRWHVQWDGAFHAAHYLVLALGLALLWPRPEQGKGQGRAFGAGFAMGFGAWHVLDAVVNHWALGLHRIRQEAEQPIWWDLAFFFLGLAALAIGLLWRRRGPAPRPEGLAMLVLAAGLGAAWPAPGPALLAFQLSDEAALRLVASADATPVAVEGGLWVFATRDPAGLARLAGARPLSGGPGGCLSRI